MKIVTSKTDDYNAAYDALRNELRNESYYAHEVADVAQKLLSGPFQSWNYRLAGLLCLLRTTTLIESQT